MNPSNRGRYYEEFECGQLFTTGARTITETDVVNFAGISGDFNPLHTNDVYMQTHPLGGRIAHGMLVAAVGTGLTSQLGLSRGTMVALLEQTLCYKAPIYFGDTIHVDMEVIDKLDTKSPEQGIIVYRWDIVNQNNVKVIEGILKSMMRKKAASK